MAKFIQYMTRDSLYDGAFDDVAGWPAAGMGYVVLTEGGRLVVIDGGQPNDGEPLFELLKSLTGKDHPVVDTWIITHPHLDHYGAILEMSRNDVTKNSISVDKLLYRYPDDFCNKNGTVQNYSGQDREMKEVAKLFGAECVTPNRGDVISVDDVTIEFLYVPDDCSIINTSNGSANHLSLIFTVSGKEKKVMITGDAYKRTLQTTVWRYTDKLKCDILQMPHHALCDSSCEDFYNYANPEMLLFPISTAGYRAMHSKHYTRLEACKVNLCLEATVKKSYMAFEGNAEIDI